MITIIVPTMWQGKQLGSMLPVLCEHRLIDEIIIIDNLKEDRNVDVSNPKIKLLEQDRNIFVNPAWNLGVSLAKNDKLMIINDDVAFDPILIDAIYDKIDESVGTITVDPKTISWVDDLSVPVGGSVSDVQFNNSYQLLHGSAIIMGIHKNSYRVIPEEFKIYFGDEFLFKSCMINNKQNLFASGFSCRTQMSKTVRYFANMTQLEWQLHKEVFAKYSIPVGWD